MTSGPTQDDQLGQDTPTDSMAGREMTFGESLVGVAFNPSGDDKVAKAKQLCADLADLLEEDCRHKETTRLGSKLYDHAIGEILNAQMNVVKVLTLKY